MKYEKIKRNLGNKVNVNETLELLLEHANGLYLKYWMINMEYDYITFIETTKDMEEQQGVSYPPRMIEIVDQLRNNLTNPKTLIAPLEIPRQKTLVFELRKIVKDHVRLLTAYSDLARIYEYILERKEGIFLKNVVEFDSDEDFAGWVLQFIFDTQDSVVINDKIKQIYGQLPIRMTKNRFFNYVDQALSQLKGITQKALGDYVTSIEELFCPEKVLGETEVFKDLKDLFEKMDGIKTEEWSQEFTMQQRNYLDTIIDTIEVYLNYYIQIMTVINEWLGLSHVVNEHSVAQHHHEVEQFTSLLETLSAQAPEAFVWNHALSKKLEHTEGVLEELLNDMGKVEGLIELALQSYGAQLHELNLFEDYINISKMSLLTSGSLFGEWDAQEEGEDPVVDSHFLGQCQRRLTDYLKTVMDQEPKQLQRSRMAITFSFLNVIHIKPQEIHDFILEAFVACQDQSEKNMSKKIIRELMKSYQSFE